MRVSQLLGKQLPGEALGPVSAGVELSACAHPPRPATLTGAQGQSVGGAPGRRRSLPDVVFTQLPWLWQPGGVEGRPDGIRKRCRVGESPVTAVLLPPALPDAGPALPARAGPRGWHSGPPRVTEGRRRPAPAEPQLRDSLWDPSLETTAQYFLTGLQTPGARPGAPGLPWAPVRASVLPCPRRTLAGLSGKQQEPPGKLTGLGCGGRTGGEARPSPRSSRCPRPGSGAAPAPGARPPLQASLKVSWVWLGGCGPQEPRSRTSCRNPGQHGRAGEGSWSGCEHCRIFQ